MPILGIMASAISGNLFGPSGAYDSIATTTVGSGGTSNISFTSIPATYKHLQIRWIAKINSGAFNNFDIRFNADTGSNYSTHDFYGNGSTTAAEAAASRTSIYGTFVDDNANIFAAGIIDILDYANTSKYKTLRMLQGVDFNGSGQVMLSSGCWMNTAATTQIDIGLSVPTYSEYSSFALYGIKGA